MKIFLLPKVVKQLRKLPYEMHEVIIGKIKTLTDKPFPSDGKKLVNREGWRIRVGDYRILYTVDNKKRELTILSVAHRKEACRP